MAFSSLLFSLCVCFNVLASPFLWFLCALFFLLFFSDLAFASEALADEKEYLHSESGNLCDLAKRKNPREKRRMERGFWGREYGLGEWREENVSVERGFWRCENMEVRNRLVSFLLLLSCVSFSPFGLAFLFRFLLCVLCSLFCFGFRLALFLSPPLSRSTNGCGS